MSSVASVQQFMDVFRFIWSILLERYNFKTSYAILLIGQTLNALITPSILDSTAEVAKAGLPEDNGTMVFRKCLYAFSLPFGRFLMGGHFVLHLVILVKLYGTFGGLRAWTVASTCSTCVNFINLGVIRNLYGEGKLLNFTELCGIFGSFNIAVLLVLIFVYKGSGKDTKGD